MTSYQYMLFDW